MEHPCIRCGACCSYFRVMFYWREAESEDMGGKPHPHPVPIELTVELDDFHRGMKGTTEKRGNRCVALTGTVGTRATCEIYSSRPTPCREFAASYENGKQNKRCDEARREHGLGPLKPSDWVAIQKT